MLAAIKPIRSLEIFLKLIPRNTFFSYMWKCVLALLLMILIFAGYLNVKVKEKFEGQRWKIPATIYAQPLELYKGLRVTQKELLSELKLLGYREQARVDKMGSYTTNGSRIDLYTRGFTFWDGTEAPRRVTIVFQGGVVSLLSEQGKSIGLLRLEPYQIGGIYGPEKEDRLLVRLEEVPVFLIEALLAIEDRQFYDHWGISFKGIARAMTENFKQRALVQGGSTITQQLVKNFYLTQDRSLVRKFIEAIMSIELEMHYDKNEILEAYLNEVYLGQHGRLGIHGVGLASQYYFDEPLNGLGPEQLALLVAIIKGPSYYNPIKHPKRAITRRNQVLKTMASLGHVAEDDLMVLQQKPLGLGSKRGYTTNRFPGFLDLVKRQLTESYVAEDLETEGLKIFTTLSPRVQLAAEKALEEKILGFEQRGLALQGDLQGSILVTAPESGEVLALVGDKNPQAVGFNRALDARRQVGSIIKPAVYLTALEQRNKYQLTTLLVDTPFTLKMQNGREWQPKNFDNQSHGELILLEALVKSYNQATARLGVDLGIDQIIQMLAKLGVSSPITAVPAVSLGAVELTPFEVTKLYQTIAANGFSSPINSIRDIFDINGEPLKRYPLEVQQVVDATAVNLLQFALQSVMDRGTGASAYATLPSTLHLAGKTGTTNQQRDSWFAGMSGNYLAVVWLGRDDNGATQLTGASGALRVWTDFMSRVSPEPYLPAVPKTLKLFWVNPDNGQIYNTQCKGTVRALLDVRLLPKKRINCFRERLNRWFNKH